ncbi:aspartyl protease family protein [Planctomycetota bacterium]
MSLACTVPSQPEPTPLPVVAWDVNGITDQWAENRTIIPPSYATLVFQIDACQYHLNALERKIDALTARVQRDSWKNTQDRFTELKATHRQLREDWDACQKVTDSPDKVVESHKVKTKLERLESSFKDLQLKIKLQDETYTSARDRYESQKRLYFESYYQQQQSNGRAALRFYTDNKVTLGLTAVDVLPAYVLITLQVYGKQKDVLPTEDLANDIHLRDSQGRDLGTPEEIAYDRLSSINGLIVSMAYKQPHETERRPAALVINRNIFANQELISLVLPNDLNSNTSARRLSEDEYQMLTLAEAEEKYLGQEQAIQCQRIGMHLKVPVVLDIHGVEVRTAMILDTGASMTVLPKSIYNRGLTKPLDSLRTVQMQTANGMATCPVDRMLVSTTAYSKTMHVALTSGSMSLLGADFFAGHRITMDLERECIVVHPAGQ